MNRSPMYNANMQTSNPEMAQMINHSPVFSSIAQQAEDSRERQAMEYNYTYLVTGTVTGQDTQRFQILIEQGTDFKSDIIMGSAYSYDSGNATDFPVPNSVGATAWAGRGLSVQIVDSRAGRELTSGFIPFETLFTPGYGMNFQHPFPFRYYWMRNSIIRFDIRNADNSSRSHSFAIILNGKKILTPEG